MSENPMKPEDSQRIQSTQAKGNKDTGKDSFASRTQSAADRHAQAQSDYQQQAYPQRYGGNQPQGGRQ